MIRNRATAPGIATNSPGPQPRGLASLAIVKITEWSHNTVTLSTNHAALPKEPYRHPQICRFAALAKVSPWAVVHRQIGISHRYRLSRQYLHCRVPQSRDSQA